MKAASPGHALVAAALLALAPAAALAQEDVKERAEDIADQANDVQQQAGALANDIANSEAATEADDAAAAEAGAAARDGADGDGDDGFDWGLLGLLGLAGLLGLTRRDHHRIPVDVHRDPRP